MLSLVELVKAGIPAKAQKSEKATRNWFAKDYAKKSGACSASQQTMPARWSHDWHYRHTGRGPACRPGSPWRGRARVGAARAAR